MYLVTHFGISKQVGYQLDMKLEIKLSKCRIGLYFDLPFSAGQM